MLEIVVEDGESKTKIRTLQAVFDAA